MNQIHQHGFAIGRVCVDQTQDIGKGIEQEMGLDLRLEQSQIGLEGLLFTRKAFDPLLVDHFLTDSQSCLRVEEVGNQAAEGDGQYNDLKKAFLLLFQSDEKKLPKDKRPYLQADQGPAGNTYSEDKNQRRYSLWFEYPKQKHNGRAKRDPERLRHN